MRKKLRSRPNERRSTRFVLERIELSVICHLISLWLLLSLKDARIAPCLRSVLRKLLLFVYLRILGHPSLDPRLK
jgi:hypothetical protein